MIRTVNKLRQVISKKLAARVTYTQTISDLEDKIRLLEERNALILRNNQYWKKRAKKYKKLAITLLQDAYKSK